MCGIMGYVGDKNATPILVDGLKRLEYRGYDSAGIAIATPDGIKIHRAEGKLANLEMMIAECPISGHSGIGHTRWATHGNPSEANAHPHRSGSIVVVHNGIIENYMELKDLLASEGREFLSETDTEVICHLIDSNLARNGGNTLLAVKDAIARLAGSYAVVIMNEAEPETLYVAKKGSPIVVGQKNGARFVASDVPALLPYTKDMMFLEDDDFAVLGKAGIKIFDENGKEISRAVQHIPWSPLMAEKGGYKHFMLKEIFEQPSVLEDVLTGRIDRYKGNVVLDELDAFFDQGNPKFDRIAIIACGTSLHAAQVGMHMIEFLAKVPVMVDYASEFRYRSPLLDGRTLVIPISQSGETADTLAAQRMAREMGCPVLAICNVVGSSVTRAADATLYIHAGPEIGVASTKAFTAQIVTLYLFALNLAKRLGRIAPNAMRESVKELLTLPRLITKVLENADDIQRIAERISDATDALYIGRCWNFPVALEGALKLKEISYIHAEGFAAGEMKHGPIALVDYGVPVVAIVSQDGTYDKMMSNLEEVKARGALTIAVAAEGDEQVRARVDDMMPIPPASMFVTPILASVQLQLLAYYVADHKGTDVDQPRNLAKSVTVE